jgi:hypothetical protein
MLYQAICLLSCRFIPSRSDSVPLVTCRFVSGLDGVKSGREVQLLRGQGKRVTHSYCLAPPSQHPPTAPLVLRRLQTLVLARGLAVPMLLVN